MNFVLPPQQDLRTAYSDQPAVMHLLSVLWQLDRQRLLGWLQPPAHQQQQQGLQESLQESRLLVIYALFETLGLEPGFLEDAALCAASVRQLADDGWRVSCGEGQRYPGFYKLLAHPDAAVRSQVRVTGLDETTVTLLSHRRACW
jgi:hypothetical protein